MDNLDETANEGRVTRARRKRLLSVDSEPSRPSTPMSPFHGKLETIAESDSKPKRITRRSSLSKTPLKTPAKDIIELDTPSRRTRRRTLSSHEETIVTPKVATKQHQQLKPLIEEKDVNAKKNVKSTLKPRLLSVDSEVDVIINLDDTTDQESKDNIYSSSTSKENKETNDENEKEVVKSSPKNDKLNSSISAAVTSQTKMTDYLNKKELSSGNLQENESKEFEFMDLSDKISDSKMSFEDTTEQSKSIYSKSVTFDHDQSIDAPKITFPKTPAISNKRSPAAAIAKNSSSRSLSTNLEESIIEIDDEEDEKKENKRNKEMEKDKKKFEKTANTSKSSPELSRSQNSTPFSVDIGQHTPSSDEKLLRSGKTYGESPTNVTPTKENKNVEERKSNIFGSPVSSKQKISPSARKVSSMKSSVELVDKQKLESDIPENEANESTERASNTGIPEEMINAAEDSNSPRKHEISVNGKLSDGSPQENMSSFYPNNSKVLEENEAGNELSLNTWSSSVQFRKSGKIDEIDDTVKKDVEKTVSPEKNNKKTVFAPSPKYKLQMQDHTSDEDENEDDSVEHINGFLDATAIDAGVEYESGDSLNEDEKEELAENDVIEGNCESLGSVDTTDDEDDEPDEHDSFIASSDEENIELLQFSDQDEILTEQENKSPCGKKEKKSYKRLQALSSGSEDDTLNQEITNLIDEIICDNEEAKEKSLEESQRSKAQAIEKDVASPIKEKSQEQKSINEKSMEQKRSKNLLDDQNETSSIQSQEQKPRSNSFMIEGEEKSSTITDKSMEQRRRSKSIVEEDESPSPTKEKSMEKIRLSKSLMVEEEESPSPTKEKSLEKRRLSKSLMVEEEESPSPTKEKSVEKRRLSKSLMMEEEESPSPTKEKSVEKRRLSKSLNVEEEESPSPNNNKSLDQKRRSSSLMMDEDDKLTSVKEKSESGSLSKSLIMEEEVSTPPIKEKSLEQKRRSKSLMVEEEETPSPTKEKTVEKRRLSKSLMVEEEESPSPTKENSVEKRRLSKSLVIEKEETPSLNKNKSLEQKRRSSSLMVQGDEKLSSVKEKSPNKESVSKSLMMEAEISTPLIKEKSFEQKCRSISLMMEEQETSPPTKTESMEKRRLSKGLVEDEETPLPIKEQSLQPKRRSKSLIVEEELSPPNKDKSLETRRRSKSLTMDENGDDKEESSSSSENEKSSAMSSNGEEEEIRKLIESTKTNKYNVAKTKGRQSLMVNSEKVEQTKRRSVATSSIDNEQLSKSFIANIDERKTEMKRIKSNKRKLSVSFSGSFTLQQETDKSMNSDKIYSDAIRHMHKKSKLAVDEENKASEISPSKPTTSSTPFVSYKTKDKQIGDDTFERIRKRCSEILEQVDQTKLESKKNVKKKSKKQTKKVKIAIEEAKSGSSDKDLNKNPESDEKKKEALRQAIKASSKILLNKGGKKQPQTTQTVQDEENKYASKRLPAEVIEAISSSSPPKDVGKKRKRVEAMEPAEGFTRRVFKSSAGDVIVESPIATPIPKKQRKKVEVLKSQTGDVYVEPLSPMTPKINKAGFRQSPITPKTTGWKVSQMLKSHNEPMARKELDAEKRIRRRQAQNVPETTNMLPLPSWLKTSAGTFKVEKLKNQHEKVIGRSGATEFKVVSLNKLNIQNGGGGILKTSNKAQKQASCVSTMNAAERFRDQALYCRNTPREDSRNIIRRQKYFH